MLSPIEVRRGERVLAGSRTPAPSALAAPFVMKVGRMSVGRRAGPGFTLARLPVGPAVREAR